MEDLKWPGNERAGKTKGYKEAKFYSRKMIYLTLAEKWRNNLGTKPHYVRCTELPVKEILCQTIAISLINFVDPPRQSEDVHDL